MSAPKLNTHDFSKYRIGFHLRPSRPIKTGRPDPERSKAPLPRKGDLMASTTFLSKIATVSTSLPTLGENASVGRRWKFRRNPVIFIASQNGASQRLLADVFDLPHSRIAAIVKEFRTKYSN
jgi:hypothetical protein